MGMIVFQYSNEMYQRDIDIIIDSLVDTKIHIIAPMFGALPMATKIRNRLKCKVSLVKMSTYYGNDEKASWVYEDDIQEDEELIIVDDLYDTGKTFKEVMDLVRKGFPDNKIRAISLHGNKHSPSWLWYVNEYPGEWIEYETWE